MSGPEKRFENKVKKYLESHGYWFIKYWAGAEYTKEGIPDILACIKGYFYGIEIKADTGKPKLLQLINLTKIREAGGKGILLYPKDFDNFINYIETSNPIWYNENMQMQKCWFKKLMK